jgi:hypothetical protein
MLSPAGVLPQGPAREKDDVCSRMNEAESRESGTRRRLSPAGQPCAACAFCLAGVCGIFAASTAGGQASEPAGWKQRRARAPHAGAACRPPSTTRTVGIHWPSASRQAARHRLSARPAGMRRAATVHPPPAWRGAVPRGTRLPGRRGDDGDIKWRQAALLAEGRPSPASRRPRTNWAARPPGGRPAAWYRSTSRSSNQLTFRARPP